MACKEREYVPLLPSAESFGELCRKAVVLYGQALPWLAGYAIIGGVVTHVIANDGPLRSLHAGNALVSFVIQGAQQVWALVSLLIACIATSFAVPGLPRPNVAMLVRMLGATLVALVATSALLLANGVVVGVFDRNDVPFDGMLNPVADAFLAIPKSLLLLEGAALIIHGPGAWSALLKWSHGRRTWTFLLAVAAFLIGSGAWRLIGSRFEPPPFYRNDCAPDRESQLLVHLSVSGLMSLVTALRAPFALILASRLWFTSPKPPEP